MLVWAIPVGLMVGVALGGLGGGGSTLTLPALVYLLGQSPAAAVTGSLVIVGISAIIGVIPHYLAGHVRLGQGIVFGALGVAGSLVGSRLSVRVDGTVLLISFAVLMVVVATLMLRRRHRTRAAGAPGFAARPRWTAARAGQLVLAATGVGLLTGFFGVGGGFAVVPALVLVLGFSMPVAIGTSLVVITVNAATALAARAGAAVQLDWVVIGTFSAVAVLGSLLGAQVARRTDPARLTVAFAMLLMVLAGYIGVRSVLAL